MAKIGMVPLNFETAQVKLCSLVICCQVDKMSDTKFIFLFCPVS